MRIVKIIRTNRASTKEFPAGTDFALDGDHERERVGCHLGPFDDAPIIVFTFM